MFDEKAKPETDAPAEAVKEEVTEDEAPVEAAAGSEAHAPSEPDADKKAE